MICFHSSRLGFFFFAFVLFLNTKMMVGQRNTDDVLQPTAFQIVSTEQVFGLLFMNPDMFQLRDKER